MKLFCSILFLAIFNLLQMSVVAQSIKNYNGPYPLKDGFLTVLSSTAQYAYYEDEQYNRIYHGAFILNGSENQTQTSYNVTGNYKHGLRHGNWQLKATIYDNSTRQKFISDIKMTYYEGKPHGKFNFTISTSSGTVSLESYINFTHGVCTGAFKLVSGENIIAEGTHDNKGFLVGRMTNINNNIEEIVDFQHKTIVSYIKRNKANGEIQKRFETETRNIEIHKKLQLLEAQNPDSLKYMSFYLDEKIDADLDKFLEIPYIILAPSSFPGDLSYDIESENYFFDGFKFNILVQQESKQERLAREQSERESQEREKEQVEIEREQQAKEKEEQATRERLYRILGIMSMHTNSTHFRLVNRDFNRVENHFESMEVVAISISSISKAGREENRMRIEAKQRIKNLYYNLKKYYLDIYEDEFRRYPEPYNDIYRYEAIYKLNKLCEKLLTLNIDDFVEISNSLKESEVSVIDAEKAFGIYIEDILEYFENKR